MNAHELALKAARGKRADARSRLDKAASALADAQRAESDAAKQVKKLEHDLEAAKNRPVYELAAAALESAKVDHLLAAKESKICEDAHVQVLTQLQVCEADVSREIERVIAAERAVKFADFERAIVNITLLAKLLARSIPNELNRIPGQALPLSPLALRVLEILTVSGDPMNTPISTLHALQFGEFTPGDDWSARRAALNAGDTIDSISALMQKNGDSNATSSLANV